MRCAALHGRTRAMVAGDSLGERHRGSASRHDSREASQAKRGELFPRPARRGPGVWGRAPVARVILDQLRACDLGISRQDFRMPTSPEDFTRLVKGKCRGASVRTLYLWYRIYLHIERYGSADTVDDEGFVRVFSENGPMSTATLARHLRRLNATGAIEGHILHRRSDAFTNLLC